nr:MAG TPA: hypothetical protein [Caudoviricetes sp.]
MDEKTTGQGAGKSAKRLKNAQKSYHTPRIIQCCSQTSANSGKSGGYTLKYFFHFMYTRMALNHSPSSAITGFNRVYHPPCDMTYSHS